MTRRRLYFLSADDPSQDAFLGEYFVSEERRRQLILANEVRTRPGGVFVEDQGTNLLVLGKISFHQSVTISLQRIEACHPDRG